MKAKLEGFQKVIPVSGKAPFTHLFTSYVRPGVEGRATEAIYVADGFPLPPLHVGMALDIDRDGRGYLVAVEAVDAAPVPAFGTAPSTTAATKRS